MISARLRYAPVDVADVEAFHDLVRDDHVRRYLMDGEIVPREWSVAQIEPSRARLALRGVGIWLVRDATTDELVGFCGFVGMPRYAEEPELVYAMRERFTGRGYATEMARAVIAHAYTVGFDQILARVDAVNGASVRVLEKLGFERIGDRPGAFGAVLLFRLARQTR